MSNPETADEAAAPPAIPPTEEAAAPPAEEAAPLRDDEESPARQRESGERRRSGEREPFAAASSSAHRSRVERRQAAAARATCRERYTKHADPAHTYKPQPARQTEKLGPPLPKDVEELAQLPALERVRRAYAELRRQLRPSKGSSTFASRTPRTSFGLVLDAHAERTPWQLRREKLEEERQQRLAAKVAHPTTTSSKEGGAKYQRSSSWARDRTERGTYMYNWQHFPETVPRRQIDPLPGPGAYTSRLHFIGS